MRSDRIGLDRIDKTRTGSDSINKTWIGLRPIDKTRTQSKKLRIDMNSHQNEVTSHNQSFNMKIKLPSFAAQALNVKMVLFCKRCSTGIPRRPSSQYERYGCLLNSKNNHLKIHIYAVKNILMELFFRVAPLICRTADRRT